MGSLLNKFFLFKNNVTWVNQFNCKTNLFFYNDFFIILFFKKLLNFDVLFVKKNNFLVTSVKTKDLFSLYNSLSSKIWRGLLTMYCGYAYSRIFIKVGLGFRKKYSIRLNTFSMNIGRRKWVVFKLHPVSFFFNLRKRNLFLFVNSKKKLFYYLTHFKTLRRETLFKFKGIMSLNRIMMNRKISRSILFARRVKFRKIKLKLTKKQKQRK